MEDKIEIKVTIKPYPLDEHYKIIKFKEVSINEEYSNLVQVAPNFSKPNNKAEVLRDENAHREDFSTMNEKSLAVDQDPIIISRAYVRCNIHSSKEANAQTKTRKLQLILAQALEKNKQL